MKRAELPSGKVLEFPDDTDEKVIRQTVRRELGVLKAEDTLDAIEKLVARMERVFSSTFEAQQKRQQAAMESIADAFQANASRLAGELGEAIAKMERANFKLGADLLKAMNGQTNLIVKLHVVMEASNKTIDAALGQSLDALDKSVAVSGEFGRSQADSLKRLSEMITQMKQTAATLQAAAGMKRRAIREGPGEWTLEPIRGH